MIYFFSWFIVFSLYVINTTANDPLLEYKYISEHHTNASRNSRPPVLCEEAKIRCALRQGCSAALQAYMLDCAELIRGRTDKCDNYCKSSLIALTSTEEGQSLVNCECTDDFCQNSINRINVCRYDVMKATAEGSVLPCSIAHLVCLSDTQCSTALSFYETRCSRMFKGKSCTFACNNSISVLKRQRNADKLSTCKCDGTESFDCAGIKKNMAELCFYQREMEEKIPSFEEEKNINTIIEDFVVPMNVTPVDNGSSVVDVFLINHIIFGLVPAIVVRWMNYSYY